MKRKLLSFLTMLWLTVSGVWAQASVNCNPSDIGKLLGSDGNVYPTASDVPPEVVVSGMIAYINTTDNWGLVISPVDLNFNGTEGSGKSTNSQAVSACSGYDRARPAAATTGWRLPTKEDFDNMISFTPSLSEIILSNCLVHLPMGEHNMERIFPGTSTLHNSTARPSTPTARNTTSTSAAPPRLH